MTETVYIKPRRIVPVLLLCLLLSTTAGAGPMELFVLSRVPGEELLAAAEAVRTGNPALAMERYRVACRRDADLPPVPRLLLGRQLLALGRLDEGRAQLELVAAEEDPIPPELHLTFGHIGVLEQRLTEAELHYERAEGLAARTVARPQRRRRVESEALAGRSELAVLRGDWAKARRLLERRLADETAATGEPGAPTRRAGLHRALGAVLVQLDDPGAAVEHFRRAAAADPAEPLPELAMMENLARRGDLSAAENWLMRAVREHPRDARAYVALGAWLLERDRIGEADAAITKAETLDGPSPAVKRLRGYIARAAGRLAEAEFCFTELLDLSPADAVVAEQLAQVLCDQESDDKRRRGLELAERNWRQSPNRAGAAATVGWARLRSSQTLAALAALERAVQLAEGRLSPEIAYFLARGLAEVGRIEDARRMVRQALAAPGFFAYRTAAREWLAGLEGPARPRPGTKAPARPRSETKAPARPRPGTKAPARPRPETGLAGTRRWPLRSGR